MPPVGGAIDTVTVAVSMIVVRFSRGDPGFTVPAVVLTPVTLTTSESPSSSSLVSISTVLLVVVSTAMVAVPATPFAV